jgi:hypothetical protein
MLTREQLLAPCKRNIQTAKFRNGEIFLREMTAGELMAFQRSIEVRSKKNGATEADPDTFAAKLMVRCICDRDGNRAMEDGDWEALQQKWSSSEIQALLPIATRLNGYASTEGNV